MKFTVKALATDVDGTLTDGEYRVNVKAIEALRRAEAKGIPVILASGNAYPMVKTLQIYLGCTGPVISEGGAVVEYRGKLRVLSSKVRAEAVVERLREVYGSIVVESWCNPYRTGDLALERTLTRDEVLKVLREYPGLKLWDSGFAYHILEGEVDKGVALKVAAELMGLTPRSIAAVGDSENDIPMFEVAGFTVAVGDADERLKRIADKIADKPDGEGFAEAVDIILKMVEGG